MEEQTFMVPRSWNEVTQYPFAKTMPDKWIRAHV